MDKLQEINTFLDKIESDPAFPSTDSAKALVKLQTKTPSTLKTVGYWCWYAITLVALVTSMFYSTLSFRIINFGSLGLLSYVIVMHYKTKRLKKLTKELYIQKVYVIISADHLTDAEKMVYLIAHQIITPPSAA